MTAKRAIVIQGGGSFGAFTVGRICKRKEHYDIAVGSSTGALIAPFALTKRYDELSHAYMNVGNKQVYTKYPFYKNGVPNFGMIVWAILRQKKGITDSKPLRNLIRQYYSPYMHSLVQQPGKELYVVVCELNKTREAAMYCRAKDYSYTDYCDMIWASTLVPVLFEPFVKDVRLPVGLPPERPGCDVEYCDGGTVENVGLKKAVELRAGEIDLYLHDTEANGYKGVSKNLIHAGIRAAVIQRQEVVDSDIYGVRLQEGTKLNTFYLPRPLTGAGKMNFQPEIMTRWYEEGWAEETKRLRSKIQ